MEFSYFYSYLKNELHLLKEAGKYHCSKLYRFLAFLYILILFICWKSFCLAKEFAKICNQYLWRNSTCVDNVLQNVPKNIAFLFADHRYINSYFISSLLYLCLLNGVDEISLCGCLFDVEYECRKIEDQIIELLSSKGVKFMSNKLLCLSEKNNLNVVYIGTEKSKNVLNQIVIKFSELDEPIKEDIFFNYLFEMSKLKEPDYFVFVGSSLHIRFGDFPPWSLRTSEFNSVGSFSNYSNLTETEFCDLIGRYSKRHRRYGK
uniref:ditrans,polycis-polyprenyl diphosphate synthase [(2E,6E)-farnesyldiphosphate specific] n=1 Tax=Meloidogyne hapla TaxID=6305 RepID=A0A1I8BAB1_MELHA